MGGFVNFICEQGVVGLAVGLSNWYCSFMIRLKVSDGIYWPVSAVDRWLNKDCTGASFTLKLLDVKANFYTAHLLMLITLIAVAFVVYAIVHFFKLDKLDIRVYFKPFN